MNTIKLAFRNIFRNKRRSIFSILAISIAALTITFLFSLLEGIKADIRNNAWNYETGQVRIRNTEYDRYEYLYPVQYTVEQLDRLVEILDSNQEVKAISPRIRIPGVVFKGSQQYATMGLGLDLAREQEFQDMSKILSEGRLPAERSREAAIGVALARDLGVGIGDSVTFLTQTKYRSANAFTVDIVGILAFPVAVLNQRSWIIPLSTAAGYMRMDNEASEVLVKTISGNPVDTAAQINEAMIEAGVEKLHAESWTKISAGYSYLQFAGIVYQFIALIFFLLAATVVISTTMMVVHERTKEIGTLAALGMSSKEIVRLFFAEACMLGFAGAAIGVLLGAAVTLPTSILGIDFGASMDMVDMGISSIFYPALNLRSTVFVFFFAWIVTMATTWPSARGAAKLKPVEALRAE
ncbi:MAG: ABC transporter permease [Spirochaetaceae bacterium]|nr:MAG: ABC transporter permease [Spirochaetaceae bacterium]